MKKVSKLFGLIALMCVGAVSLPSCSVFEDDGYIITDIDTYHDDESGYTVVTIHTNSEDEDEQIITFTIDDGVEGVSIESITSEVSSDGKSVIITISYTDPSYSDTVITVPVVNGKDGRSVTNLSTSYDSNGNVVVTFTYSDGSEDSFTIPKGLDGNGISNVVVDTTSKEGYTLIIFYFTDPSVPPTVVEIPDGKDGVDGEDGKDGEDGVSIVKITKDEAKSNSKVAVYVVLFSDGSTQIIKIDLPQATIWHSGELIPDSTIGKDGDFYLNTLTGYVYRRYGDTWVFIFSMKGSGSPVSFEVTFNLNGGKWSDDSTNSKTYIVDYGQYLPLDKIPVPIKDGSTFNGWYTALSSDPNFVNAGKFTDLVAVMDDIELYAYWL